METTGAGHAPPTGPAVHWDVADRDGTVSWPGLEGEQWTLSCDAPVRLSFSGERLVTVDVLSISDRLRGVGISGAPGRHYFDSGWLWLPLSDAPVTRQVSGPARVEVTLVGQLLVRVRFRLDPATSGEER
ncbi:hypothetical protein [Actinoplanes teichomyceticus]|uniref:hypothetical protein n=1 Tax=Actinoplanes teichomyceticus TaxID=1867 RepID=UPI0011A36DC2|nr:hypothetical protein [Actinoplanes teichomyceticus]